MYFQHDGAPPHYTIRVREFLNEIFPCRWLGRGGPVARPPRSPDVVPMDYYLCGHMKTLVYDTKVDVLYSSPNIVRVIKSRRMRWAGHVARMGGERGVYRVFVGKP